MAFDVEIHGNSGEAGHVREVIRNFVKFDIHSTLMAKASKNELLFEKVKIIKVRHISIPGLGLISRFFINILVGALELITNEYDVIYERYAYFTVGGILGRLFGIPVIYEINGILSDEYKVSNKNSNSTFLKIFNYWEKFTFKLPQKFITVTQGIKDYLIKDYEIEENNIFVVENGFSIDIFGYKPDIKEKLNLDIEKNYICFVGLLAPWQGIEYLIKAAPNIIRRFPNVRFLIVGDGPMKKELTELANKIGINNNFIFTGSVPHEHVPSYINASDICVAYKIPLRSGYSALKLYEYMACGKPVVASRLKGFEVLEDTFSGLLAEPENPEKLANAIITLLENKPLREEMGRNGREHVMQNLSWEAATRKIEKACKIAVVEFERKKKKNRLQKLINHGSKSRNVEY